MEWETLFTAKIDILKHNLIVSPSYLKSVNISPLPIVKSSKPLTGTRDFHSVSVLLPRGHLEVSSIFLSIGGTLI